MMDNQLFSKEELLKQAEANAHYQEVALEASEEVLTKQFDLVMQVVRQYNVSPRDLISNSVLNTNALPQKLRAEIAKLPGKMQTIIAVTAEQIENQNYRPLQDSIDGNFQVAYQRERANRLITVVKKVSVSTRTLRLTAFHFVALNRRILEHLQEADRQHNSTMAREAVLANAILVYELCDYVIRFIENFQMIGFQELQNLKKEVESARQRFRQVQETRKRQAATSNISAIQRKAALEDIQRYEEALQKREKAWKTYWEQIDKVRKGSQEYVENLPDLRLMRDRAGDRLDFITLMDLDYFISTNLQNLELTAQNIVNQLDMPPMTPNLFELLYGEEVQS